MASVVPAILNETRDPSVREAMLLGSYLEGGWSSPYPVGDSGHSHGPYQINLPFHPDISAAQAEDPVYATDYMYGRYVSAVVSVNPLDWINNPEMAAEKAAFRAENPARIYHESRGQATVDRAWAATVNVLKQAGQPLGPGGEGQTPTPVSTDPGGGGGTGLSAACQAIVQEVASGQSSITPGLVKRWQDAGCGSIGDLGKALQEATGLPGAGSGGPIVQGAVGAAKGVAGVFGSIWDVLSFIFSLRFLEIVGGGVLVLLGLFLLGKQLASSPAPS